MRRNRLLAFAPFASALALSLSLFAGNAGAAPAAAGSTSAHVMGIVHSGTQAAAVKAAAVANLTYHGGVSGSGVETGADKVYLIYWGSQWNNNDPVG